MNKRLKAAVIGTGFIGGAHVEALKRVPGVDGGSSMRCAGKSEQP